jgi:hypothetical protein
MTCTTGYNNYASIQTGAMQATWRFPVFAQNSLVAVLVHYLHGIAAAGFAKNIE